jgi:catechol 2,3-dioxygenase-like lactoylglutathione lyase family enzyme
MVILSTDDLDESIRFYSETLAIAASAVEAMDYRPIHGLRRTLGLAQMRAVVV